MFATLAAFTLALPLSAADSPPVRMSERERAIHVLDRLAYGPRPGEVDKVLSEGVDAWVARQLQPEAISDSAVEAKLRSYRSLSMSAAELYNDYPDKKSRLTGMFGSGRKPAEVAQELASAKVLRAVESERQLQEVMTDFWFNHFNEGSTQGQLARRLAELGGSIAAFYKDLGSRGDDVLLLTMTEFGRTLEENGNGGTDHGHGSVMTLFGPVKGGKVYGRWPGLGAKALYESRDLAVTTDYRSVVSEVLGGHLGLADTSAVFPGGPVAPLGLLQL